MDKKCRRSKGRHVISDTHRNLVMEELDVFVGLVKNRCGIGLMCEDTNDKLGHYRSQTSLVQEHLFSPIIGTVRKYRKLIQSRKN